MGGTVGKVGGWHLRWKSAPRGSTGSAALEAVRGSESVSWEVRWRKDAHGIWIELPSGVHGFDLEGERGDDGRLRYLVSERESDRVWRDLAFLRAGEEQIVGAAGARKGGTKAKAQMPGKIVRVLAKAGDIVAKDQPVLVMEAMKMENEIRAAVTGKLEKISVSEGQAVETGAELFVISAQ
jgi:acetyl/propionyl-CoA carboxylase alpha subunit